MTTRRVGVEVPEEQFTPKGVAVVSFQAGWRAAFAVMEELLRSEGAPAPVLDAVRAAGAAPPVPRVGIGLTRADAQADADGKAVRS